MTEERADRGVRARPGERGVPVARARGGAPGGRPGRAAPVPRGAAGAGRGHPGVRRARVRVRARRRPDPGSLGPGRHRAGRGRAPVAAAHASRGRRRRRPRADVVEPTLSSLGAAERVTITDYKSSDVRDPAARQRARESLQLQIYAMAYEAQTGRLPGCGPAALPRSGLVGRAEVDPQAAGEGPRADRRARPRASGRATSRPGRTALACTYCPFRDICPSSARPSG